MRKLNLNPKRERLEILCLGAHSDDIEIGCGGTLLRLLEENPGAVVHWVVFSARGQRESEARASAELFLKNAGERQILLHQFRDGYLPYQGAEVKDRFEELKSIASPDIVFTHYRDDRHQDHREVSNLTWNTFRNHLVLEYEVPKFDGDLGSPNTFVELEESVCKRKVQYLHQCFSTQATKPWFAEETFMGLMRLRGMESCSATNYAEAFYGRKIVLI